MLASPKTFASRSWPDPLDRGLVGEWRFDRATGLLLPDYSGYAINGIIDGAIWEGTSKGTGLRLDGTNDAVDLGYVARFDRVPLTIETYSIPRGWGIAGDGYRNSIFNHQAESPNPNAGWAISYGGSYGTEGEKEYCGASIRTGSWRDLEYGPLSLDQAYHITLTIPSGSSVTYRLYVDAVERDTIASSGSYVPTGGDVNQWFGRWANGASRWGNCDLLLGRIYNRILSAAEVAERNEIVLGRRMEVGAPHLWRVLWGVKVPAPPAGNPWYVYAQMQ